MKIGLYNTAHALADSGKPIFIPFGTWPYDRTLMQTLDKAHGLAIANELNARVAAGRPGIPVYQGHPDVPSLAAKYPDKGALGWVVHIDLANEDGRDGLALTVDWDRDPGNGFKWFSPYWSGANEGGVAVVESIESIGLVNNPNIDEFRLPNESAEDQQKGNTMKREELVALLGLPPEATDDDIKLAIAANRKAAEKNAADEQKLAAANAEKDAACCDAKAARSDAEKATAELENERKAHEATRAALANETARTQMLLQLKTQSATAGLPNERLAPMTRLALVNEIQKRDHIGFDAAWAAAKNQAPDLFK